MLRRLVVAVSIFVAACASAPPARIAEMVETAPGVALHVERIGAGPNVVLIPGRLFMPQMARLARADRTLILYDMRNRGASARVEDGSVLTIEHDVQDLEALRARYGAERVSLVGFSYLGLMTAIYASRHPHRAERLVQLGPAPRQVGTTYAPEHTADDETLPPEALAARAAMEAAFAAATLGSDQAELCRIQRAYTAYLLVGDPARRSDLADPCVFPNEFPLALRRHFGNHFADLRRRTFPRADFERLTAPVLTIHGTLDRNAPYGAGREWAQTFLDGRLITIENGAHSVWVDDPAVIDDIDVFLDGRWPIRAESITP